MAMYHARRRSRQPRPRRIKAQNPSPCARFVPCKTRLFFPYYYMMCTTMCVCTRGPQRAFRLYIPCVMFKTSSARDHGAKQRGHCHGLNASGVINDELNRAASGAAAPMHARHSCAPRAATRPSRHACALGYLQISMTLFSCPSSV